MLGTHDLLAFIVAGLLLDLVPGPDMMYILGRSVTQGTRAGVLSVLGVSSGIVFHVVATAFGLSALWATSVAAFTAIKAVGAMYLIYMGVRMLRDKESLVERSSLSSPGEAGWKIYRQGVLTNVFNPKMSLFMIAFLPQFVQPEAKLGCLPFLFLGAIFAFNSTLWSLLVAFCGAKATAFIRKHERFDLLFKRCTGLLFVALGLNLLRSKAH